MPLYAFQLLLILGESRAGRVRGDLKSLSSYVKVLKDSGDNVGVAFAAYHLKDVGLRYISERVPNLAELVHDLVRRFESILVNLYVNLTASECE